MSITLSRRREFVKTCIPASRMFMFKVIRRKSEIYFFGSGGNAGNKPRNARNVMKSITSASAPRVKISWRRETQESSLLHC